jgi:hypothetical protein
MESNFYLDQIRQAQRYVVKKQFSSSISNTIRSPNTASITESPKKQFMQYLKHLETSNLEKSIDN